MDRPNGNDWELPRLQERLHAPNSLGHDRDDCLLSRFDPQKYTAAMLLDSEGLDFETVKDEEVEALDIVLFGMRDTAELRLCGAAS
jgi:hypothetical protein